MQPDPAARAGKAGSCRTAAIATSRHGNRAIRLIRISLYWQGPECGKVGRDRQLGYRLAARSALAALTGPARISPRHQPERGANHGFTRQLERLTVPPVRDLAGLADGHRQLPLPALSFARGSTNC